MAQMPLAHWQNSVRPVREAPQPAASTALAEAGVVQLNTMTVARLQFPEVVDASASYLCRLRLLARHCAVRLATPPSSHRGGVRFGMWLPGERLSAPFLAGSLLAAIGSARVNAFRSR